MAAFTLQIDANRRARWSVDGRPVADFFEVRGAKAEAVDEVGRRFQALFGQGTRPLADPESLRGMGRTLFDAWFAPSWEALQHASNGSDELILRSEAPALLDLPWELVEITPGLPIGCDAAWSLRRASTPEAVAHARPGPLRVLFLAAAPIDQDQLDYEREEDLMLRASADVKGTIVAHFAETGGIDELAGLVAECRPHVVHLSGHGDVINGQGVFAFEDERGRTDLRTSDEIAAKVFRGNDVRLAFINGCKTSQAAVSGLCRELVAAGVPSALGWAASVIDDRATDFAAEFYRRLVRGEPTPTAAAHAREALRRNGLVGKGEWKMQDATFALPQLYSSDASAMIDATSSREIYVGPRTEYALLGEGIVGLRHGFVGRRREVQRMMPALRQGDSTFAVITGIGGSGKSTLATRAANRLQHSLDYRVVAVKIVARPTPSESARDTARRLIEALGEAFLLEKREDLYGHMTLGNISPGRRLKLAISGLKELKLVLILDNFEDVLDLETRRISDPDLAGFIEALATNLVQGSRAIITCRYLPEGTPVDLPNVLHLPLPEFPGHDAFKFLRRDDIVDQRIGKGEITRDLIDRLYRVLGGTPGLLVQVRTLLRKADPDALIDELEGGDPGMIAREREAYSTKILTTRLYAALSPEAQAIARRLALSALPLPIDVAATLAVLTEPEVVGPLEEGVAYGMLQRFDDPDHPPLYHPPGLLRYWLTAPERLDDDEAKTVHAHLAAFWRSSYESDRMAELRVGWIAELEACRDHARQADDVENHRWATVRIARGLTASSDWERARSLLEEVTEVDRDGDTWHALASIDLEQGDYSAAREKLNAAMLIRRAIADLAGEAATWHQLATIDLRQGDYAAAREKFDVSIQIKRAIGDRAGEAATWHQLATIDLELGDYAAARDKFDATMKIKSSIGDLAGVAGAWHALATIDLELGDYAAARDKFDASMQIKRAIGDRAGEAATWHQLASSDVRQGNYAEARAKFVTALQIRRDIGDRAGEAGTWHNLGTIDLSQGDYASAREKFNTAQRIHLDIGDRAGEAITLHCLASIDLEQGDFAAAREKFDTEMQIMKAMGNRAGEAGTWHQLATIDMEQGNYTTAREKFETAHQIRRDIGDRAGQAGTLHSLGSIDVHEGNYAAAREKFDASMLIKRAIGDRAGEAATWHYLATIDMHEGNYAAAREKFDTAMRIMQVIGDRAGEAATFFQLGMIAYKKGHSHHAARLVAICRMITHSIGHRHAEIASRQLSDICSDLGYDQDRVEAMRVEVAAAYQEDGGRGLIERAFAEDVTDE